MITAKNYVLQGYNLKIFIQWGKLTLGRGEVYWGQFSQVGGDSKQIFGCLGGTPPILPVGKTLYCGCNTTRGTTSTNRIFSMDFEIVEAKILIFPLVRASRIKNCGAHFCASKGHMCTVMLYLRLLCIQQCILLPSYLMFGTSATTQFTVRGQNENVHTDLFQTLLVFVNRRDIIMQ